MADEDFNTDAFFTDITKELNKNKKSFHAICADDSDEVSLHELCVSCVSITRDSLLRHLNGYDENKAWLWFLKESETFFK